MRVADVTLAFPSLLLLMRHCRRREAVIADRVRRHRHRGMGGNGAYRARPGAARPGSSTCRRHARSAPRTRASSDVISCPTVIAPVIVWATLGHRRRDHGGGGAVVHRPWRTAPRRRGRDGRRGRESAARRAVGLDRAGAAIGLAVLGLNLLVMVCATRWMCAAWVGWHDRNRIPPTHVRALRETFKALRTSEFPWTRRHDLFEQRLHRQYPSAPAEPSTNSPPTHRAAPSPGWELFAVCRSPLGIGQLINANPSEIALATNTGFGLNLAARALR